MAGAARLADVGGLRVALGGVEREDHVGVHLRLAGAREEAGEAEGHPRLLERQRHLSLAQRDRALLRVEPRFRRCGRRRWDGGGEEEGGGRGALARLRWR